MKLTAFRVENYRCIFDSGWVETDDIAVVVGKNESGKTSLLKALWKFNPFHDVGYSLNREWPRGGRRKEMSPEKIVVTVRFTFTPEEIALIEGIHESAKGITEVEIERNYKGTYFYKFLPNNPNKEYDVEWVMGLLEKRLGESPSRSTVDFKNHYATSVKALMDDVRANGGHNHAVAKLPEFKELLSSFENPNHPNNPTDQAAIQRLSKVIDETLAEIENTPLLQVINAVHKKLPTFIYMDDYRSFCGTAQLDEVKKRKDTGRLTPEDEMLMQIMEMSGLDLEKEVKKGQQEDREQRRLDMNEASLTLTSLLSSRWSQKHYAVEFHADGEHFITFVKDADAKVLVPLEERSKGFQWFFSFDMMLMYETKGKFENAIILLDEPGLHLHATAQADLLKRLKAYAEKNQLIYSTHLPFMVDYTRLDNIYVAEDISGEGVKVHKNWVTVEKDSRFTLQAALGLSLSQSLFEGQYNLLVESVADFWFLSTISTMLRDAGQEGLDEQLTVTPVGGASKAAYVGTILHGQKLNVALLFNSDPEGNSAYEQLVHQWLMDAKHVLRVGDLLGSTARRTLEDLFDETYYLGHVNAAYLKEFAGRPLAISSDKTRSIVERIEEALKARGMDKFNKGRVAKRIIFELVRKKFGELPKDTAEGFKKIITAVNGVVADWKKSGAP